MKELCSASRVLVYSSVFWHEAIMDGAKANSWGARAPRLEDLPSGTNTAAYVVHWEWRHLSHDCSTGITLLLYLHIKNYFSDFSRMSEKLDCVLSASQTSERWSAVIHWAGNQEPCHSLGLNKSFNWKTAWCIRIWSQKASSTWKVYESPKALIPYH